MNENKILNLIGRTQVLFEDDIKDHHDELEKIGSSSLLTCFNADKFNT